MYAIIKTGGKQYRVGLGDEFKIEKVDAEIGAKINFDQVLAVGGETLQVGNPYVEGLTVEAEVTGQGKNDKVIIYKYKAKKDYRRKNGHRQPYTMVRITAIGSERAPEIEEAVKAVAEAVEEKVAEIKANASMKKDELLAIAEEMGIEVSSKATKADILAAIESK